MAELEFEPRQWSSEPSLSAITFYCLPSCANDHCISSQTQIPPSLPAWDPDCFPLASWQHLKFFQFRALERFPGGQRASFPDCGALYFFLLPGTWLVTLSSNPSSPHPLCLPRGRVLKHLAPSICGFPVSFVGDSPTFQDSSAALAKGSFLAGFLKMP